jgi:hypothetical protein
MSKRIGLRTIQSIGGFPCKVTIEVYQDGEATLVHTVEIKGKSFHHGNSSRFPKGTYSLSWTSRDTAYFYKWETTGNISVENEYLASTNLTVSCGGTLTLKVTSNPAFNYDNLVGTIWMPEPQGYDKRSEGSIMIAVRDPYGTSPAGDLNGGSYDNR